MTLKVIPSGWRQILRSNFRHWEKLADFLELNESQREKIIVKKCFPLNLPFRLAGKIEKRTLDDPILKQFLPIDQETVVSDGYVSDPVGDQASRRGAKLLHKYRGRVLLVCTGVCAMHCRYCFRQNFSYDVEDKTFVEELEIIEKDPSIHEVILSGGDPLSLSDNILRPLLEKISAIPHINRIRFHTRFPIGIPERIDDDFIAMLESLPVQIWFVIHSNHPNELDETVFSHLKRLQKIGVSVCNQAVLLKGVNDNVPTLKELCEKLVDHGVFAYYLHQLDRVLGAGHFEVAEKKGLRLIEEVSKQLPGYGVPQYVREISGEPGKTPVISLHCQ